MIGTINRNPSNTPCNRCALSSLVHGTPGKLLALLWLPLQNRGYLYTEDISGNSSA